MAKKEKNTILPIIAILISMTSLFVSIRSCDLNEKKMKLHLEPQLTCILDYVPQKKDKRLLFTLKNEGPIDASNVSVDHCTMRYSKETHRIVLSGYDNDPFDYSALGQNWIFQDIMRPNQRIHKFTGDFIAEPETAIYSLSFDIHFYRPEDGQKYNKECLYFIDGQHIMTPTQLKTDPEYTRIISETYRYLRQHTLMNYLYEGKKQ